MKSIKAKSKLRTKGQVTIPRIVRSFLQLNEEDIILFSVDTNENIVTLSKQDISQDCPLCEGYKLIDDTKPCFLCCGEGEIDFNDEPYNYFKTWNHRYNVSISYTQSNSDEQLHQQVIAINAPDYQSTTLRKAEELLKIWFLKQRTLSSEDKASILGNVHYYKELAEQILKEGDEGE